MASRRPVDLLPDREASTLSTNRARSTSASARARVSDGYCDMDDPPPEPPRR
ncbi:hypothetical protein ACIPRD_09765 [Streptomyces sp. NPDC090108]|uniref:hypothetical protein n=1 Tax=Streptomyces sp. NPDC090108 TaxID=3365947 RepID=UPI003810DAC8